MLLTIPTSYIYFTTKYTKQHSFPVELLLFTIYSASISTFGFIFVTGLKLDDILTGGWYIVFIPAWYALLSFTFFTSLIFSVLMQPNYGMMREALTLVFMDIAIIISSILLAMWLNNDLEHLWSALMPTEITAFLVMIAWARNKFGVKKDYFPVFDAEGRFYLALIIHNVISSIKAEVDGMPKLFLLLIPITYTVMLWAGYERAGAKPVLKEKNDYEIERETINLKEN
jgi:hypothetical protein